MRPCEAVPNVLGVDLRVFAGRVPCQEDRLKGFTEPPFARTRFIENW